jgi:hypothetical protein
MRRATSGNETDLKREIVLTLRRLGFLVYVTSERRRGYSKMPTGWPDCFARHITRRFCVWIEVKQPGKELRLAQEDFRAAAIAAGENHWTVDAMAGLYAQLARAGIIVHQSRTA